VAVGTEPLALDVCEPTSDKGLLLGFAVSDVGNMCEETVVVNVVKLGGSVLELGEPPASGIDWEGAEGEKTVVVNVAKKFGDSVLALGEPPANGDWEGAGVDAEVFKATDEMSTRPPAFRS
jgi:hypothetical protein